MVLIWAEEKEGILPRSTLEVLSMGKKIAEPLGEELGAVLIADSNRAAGTLGKKGVRKVYAADDPALRDYRTEPYTQIFTSLIEEHHPSILLLSHTSSGKDLAPRVAARLNVGLISDCTQLELQDGSLVATRPMYTGKALAQVTLPAEMKPKIFTLRPKAFPASEEEEGGECEVIKVEVPQLKARTEVLELKKAPKGSLDVAEADIVVSGGRGLKGPENFEIIEELAQALGAAVGASRAVVDAGWRDHKDQVGQTGKQITPKLYFACGISGAIQHQVGMRNSKCIVAINKDPNAPIFKLASYGIVGDLFKIVPLLTEELKKIRD